MVNRNFLSLIFIFLIIMPFISSNGLIILGQSNITMNKTIGIPAQIVFEIYNSENFMMYNVSENSPYINFDTISQLDSGASINITADITATTNFNGVVDIFGLYQSQLGMLNETHNIDISYESGGGFTFTQCDFSIVNGDSVIWNNVHEYAILKIINADTLQEIVSLSPNTSYIEVFQDPLVFNYYLSRYGFPSQVCEIAILDDTGIITNPLFDAGLALNIQIIYPSTSLTPIFLETNYSITAGENIEDIFKLTNDGDKIAKNVHLSGDWFTFSINNFDMMPGESRNIGYWITPTILTTNDTDKNYNKELLISGNFDNVYTNFTIYIPHMIISSSFFENRTSFTSLMEQYIEMVIAYCDEYDDEICNILSETVILGSGTNGSTSQFEIAQALIDFMDSQAEHNSMIKTQQDNVIVGLAAVDNRTSQYDGDMKSYGESIKGYNSGVIFLAMLITVIVVCGILYVITRLYEKKNSKFKYGVYH